MKIRIPTVTRFPRSLGMTKDGSVGIETKI